MEQSDTAALPSDHAAAAAGGHDKSEAAAPPAELPAAPASLGINPQQAANYPRAIGDLYRQLLRYQGKPLIHCRINPTIGNVEYLIADDLAPWLPLNSTPSERARRFLKDEAQLFGLDEQWIDQTLFLKHEMSSYMGSHYIFGLRGTDSADQEETLNSSLVFHFDPHDRLVMVTGCYHPQIDAKRMAMGVDEYESKLRATGLPAGLGVAGPAVGVPTAGETAQKRAPAGAAAAGSGQGNRPWNNAKVEETLRKIAQDLLIVGPGGKAVENPAPQPQQIAVFQPERKRIFNRKTRQMETCVQVKHTTTRHDAVFIVDGQGEVIECFYVDARAGIHIAYIYRQFWQTEEPIDDLQKVVLHHLAADTQLVGRYADVRDVAGFTKSVEWDLLLNDPKSSFNATTTLADGILVYYHIDRIQRYFRELGLTVLDQYPGLNPIRAELGADETKFQPNGQRILFRSLKIGSVIVCTEARSPHIIYHEFVHAVTDALARLRRDSDSNEEKEQAWRIQVRQTHGLDEGYADYFACSLAMRQGATFTTIGALQADNDGKITVVPNGRDLDNIGDDLNAGQAPPLERMVAALKMPGDQPAQWPDAHLLGRAWAAYLWQCRKEMTPDIADVIIAHSIFFLTRWSTVGMAVRALVLADRLLFGGANEQIILEKAGGQAAEDWTTY